MDIDRFIARNAGAWTRLDELNERARKGVRRLAPGELDELLQLYQRASAHLSHARSYYGDPGLTARLTRLVASANGVVYGSRTRSVQAVVRFFATTFPASVWAHRRFVAASAALLFVPALVVGVWLARSDRALDVAIPPDRQEALLASEFEDYYSSAPAQSFSTTVMLNNIRVAFLALALGAAACVAGAVVLASNGMAVGEAAGLFASVGQLDKFFGLILPHGLLELSAIVVAGGAGLAVGWALVAPGDRTRPQALADEGRRAMNAVLGLVVAFVVAGLIEGFVTPSSLPTGARVGIGAAVCAAFWAYVVTRGRTVSDAADDWSDKAPSLAPRARSSPAA